MFVQKMQVLHKLSQQLWLMDAIAVNDKVSDSWFANWVRFDEQALGQACCYENHHKNTQFCQSGGCRGVSCSKSCA